MKFTTIFLTILVLFLTGACSGGGGEGDTNNYYGTDDDDDDTGDDDSADDDDAVDDDDDDDDDATPSTISGRVLPFPRADQEMIPAHLLLVDNATAEPFGPPVVADADEDGYFTLYLPSGLPPTVGVKMTVSGSLYGPVYAFDLAVGDDDVRLRFPEGQFFSYLLFWNMWMQSSKGHAFGVVEWEGAAAPEPVGCALVAPDRSPGASGELTYFTDVVDPPIYYERTETDPNYGAFVATNYTPGDYAFGADADGDQVLSAVHPLLADSWTFVRVTYPVANFPLNPTPGGCE